jgi:hypothetical protein
MSEPLLQFFVYNHLRLELQDIARPFADLAYRLVETIPANPQRGQALTRLLEAKDAAVRAWLYKEPEP